MKYLEKNVKITNLLRPIPLKPKKITKLRIIVFLNTAIKRNNNTHNKLGI